MNEQSFFKSTEEILNLLYDFVENKEYKDLPDVELNSGVLTIDFDELNLHYVINRHNASGQMWLSSSVSGASYFEVDSNNIWQPVKGAAKQSLEDIVKQELNAIE